ncbi:MAG TPA: TRAP transporter substrate-binding protein [Stellaceae bacterium]|nr:TRAP transporter substrate-binding protein [Stellaceae bacterium]
MKRLLLSRRAILAGAAASAMAAPTRRGQAAVLEMRQFHNQPADTPLHRRLVELWDAVERETEGRLKVRVFAENGGIADGDPQALRMLRSGELDFFTLMGGILGEVVPAADVQSIPFAFRSSAEVYGALDGDLGEHLRRECAAAGIYMLPRSCFENGFRHITSARKPIRDLTDLAGLKIRTPQSELFLDAFRTLGAEPLAINVNRLYDALKAGTVEAQENPLIVAAAFRLFEVQHYVSLTRHAWSGFNLLAHLERWRALPEDIRRVIERHAGRVAVLQRADNDRLNERLREALAERGMVFNETDVTGFRERLKPFYARWRERVGAKTWAILEAHVGVLG